MERRTLRALLLAALIGSALGYGPAWYSCDEGSCEAPDCQCASDQPPAGLAPEEVPQFIVLTHDDAISTDTNSAIRKVIDQHKNRNGCNMPATFFVLQDGNDCTLAKAFWEENSELGAHTVSHVALNNPFTSAAGRTLAEEMLGVRDYLNQTCGIPLEDIVGFRAPLLFHNPPVREVLAAAGMLYDSSILEQSPSDTSPNGTSRLWPYTMDAGIPQDCAYFTSPQACTQNESYPGLWEFPLLETEDKDGADMYAMDPGRSYPPGASEYDPNSFKDIPSDQLFELMKENFDKSYYGNRAPFGIYTHTPWFSDNNIKAANQFLEYALGLPDTWVVTVRQVIEWMKDPVPASNMSDWLTCNPVDLTKAPGTEKCLVYTAVEGDYGEVIAAKFGVAAEDLIALNPDIATLAVGDAVLIPPFDDSCGDGIPAFGPGNFTAPAPAAAN